MTKLEQNKERFIELCKTNITTRNVKPLLDAISKTDFFIAPCSTKYHLNYRGGLCEHSLNVYDVLCNLCTSFGVNVQEHIETITIISLFHDYCKANFYKPDLKTVKVNNQWVQQSCYTIDDMLPLGHGEKSVILLQQSISLTNEEMLAIRWHMSGFDNAVKGGDYALNTAYHMSIFVTLLQCADLISSNILEKTD